MFTDIFIKRPVLATVISLLILLFGLRALHVLPLRQFPKMENTVITITTTYPGASAETMQGFVTSPIEKGIAGADGVDYVTAESTLGVSTIKAYVRLNFDPQIAFTDIQSKVASVRNFLPKDVEDPVLQKDTGSQIALMYISFNSSQMTPEQITDYVSRVVQPKIETVAGVASAQILGASTFAMRIWLNPKKMAALNISSADVMNALQANNYQSAPGQTKGEYVAFNISANTDLRKQEQFENLVVKNENGALIHLRDIAKIKLGSQDYDSSVIFNGKKAVFIGVTTTPTANPLDVISGVRQILPEIQKNFPSSLTANVVYDATDYIRASIHEVIKTIVEATVIVIIVIFLFLGSLRSVIIPVITIPLSLIGVCSLMLALGYSINLLTLLAMVLAIGLVVDDAIVVVENIYRHIEEGMKPFDAAIQGAREIATPVIAMSITLAAVFAPIGFMTGLTGALFKEFAFTLACSVIISGIIALTLSPMMCSRFLSSDVSNIKFVHYLDTKFEQLKHFYLRRLHSVLDYRPVTLVFAATVLLSCYFLFSHTQKELAPTEDQSVLFMFGTAPQYANIDYVTRFTQQFDSVFKNLPETQDYFLVNGMNTVNTIVAGDILKPWDQRKRSQAQVMPIIQNELNKIAGLQVWVTPLPSLPVSSEGPPIQFILTTTGSYETLYQAAQQLTAAALRSGLFMFIDSSLKFDNPSLDLNIDQLKAGQMGITMQDVGNTLAANLGGNYVNLFNMQGRSYEVIPQLQRPYRLNPNDITQIYIRAQNGAMIPLSTIATVKQKVEPNSLTEFQQLNSTTLQGMMMPGKTMGDALNFLQNEANKILPKGITYDYGGESRQYVQESNALVYTFFFAIIVIFLVLSAQFESFRDPLIILVSVPMSICGALIPLNLGAATINIYTEIGLITLIGLISKHGILMVDFANKLQIAEGLSIREAIEKSASIRLRPILMTTAAIILGVLPLILAQGAGAESRFDIGLVVASGMLIGTLFTLFVVPTMYTFLAKKRVADKEDTVKIT